MRKRKVVNGEDGKLKDSKLARSFTFRNSFSTDKKVRLCNKEGEGLKGYLTLSDLKHLSGGTKNVSVYIPIQYSIKGKPKKDAKYTREDKYNYEIKYLRFYILLEDILNYLGFPLSIHNKILSKDLEYITLENMLNMAEKRKGNLGEGIEIVGNKEGERELLKQKALPFLNSIRNASSGVVLAKSKKWFNNNKTFIELSRKVGSNKQKEKSSGGQGRKKSSWNDCILNTKGKKK